jgi:hypothetical protein
MPKFWHLTVPIRRYRQLPNMSTNSAAHQKKVDAAVRILETNTGLRVPQAMILAGFLKSDAANKIVRQAVWRRKQQLESNACCGRPSLINKVVIISDEPSLSDLTSKNNGSPTSTSTMTFSGLTNPKPKQKQTRSTASAVQQRHIDNLKTKRHKSDAHKAAMRLYGSKRQKPDGMSIWQVIDVITSRFETCPSKATIAC